MQWTKELCTFREMNGRHAQCKLNWVVWVGSYCWRTHARLWKQSVEQCISFCQIFTWPRVPQISDSMHPYERQLLLWCKLFLAHFPFLKEIEIWEHHAMWVCVIFLHRFLNQWGIFYEIWYELHVTGWRPNCVILNFCGGRTNFWV